MRKCGSGILLHCTKIICCASQEGIKGQPPRASKWPKMLIWYNFDQFLLFFLFLRQHELYFVRKCGPGILLLHCTKIPCCDSQERIKVQPLGASKWPKMVIWHSFYHFLLFLFCFSTNMNYIWWENVTHASSSYTVVKVKRGWRVSHQGPQKGQNW